MKYPALIITPDDGWQAIVPGHGLSAEVLADAERRVLGEPPDDEFTEVEEVFFDFHPRMKHCARITGWEGCDHEGEWHGHWVEVLPSKHAETFFTLIRHTDLEPARTDAANG